MTPTSRNSALLFTQFNDKYSYEFNNETYLKAPSDVYFGGKNFTITVWIYPQQITYWERIIDFGLGSANNNLIFAVSSGTSGKPALVIYINNTSSARCVSSKTINLNEWTHLAAVQSTNNVKLYMNLTMVGNCTSTSPLNVTRRMNLIGKSNWPDDPTIAQMFMLRIYNRSLNLNELHTDFILT